ncbi:putative thioredoxin [Mycobacterium tuberculosis RGTB327]|nr:putative thioredoxin [Mycobacterium tuberculosis RGTB327]
MAGAVDLSGIKQRAQQNAAASTDADRALSTPSGVTEITEANFEDEVIVRSDEVPVVVLLWSPRSEVCVDLLDTLSGLAAAAKGKWSLASVNVDVAPRVAQIFGVQAVPTVVALAAGQPISSFQGLQPADQLSRWVDSLLSATAGKLKGAASSEEGPPKSIQRWHRRASSSRMATLLPRASHIRRFWMPTQEASKPRRPIPPDRIPHPRNRTTARRRLGRRQLVG